MRAFVTTIASLLLAPFLASLAVEIVKPALPPGLRVIQWLNAVYEATAFPWVVAGAGGVLLGLWLDRISARFDGRNPLTASGKIRKIAPSLSAIATECEMANLPHCSHMVNQNSLRAKLYLLGQRLAKLGISEPYITTDATPWVMFHNTSTLLRAIHPAMEEGSLEAARYISSLVREGQIRNPTKEPSGSYI